MADDPKKWPDSPGDFGVPEKNIGERQYTSENTKASDPGASHPRAGTQGRTSGVGGQDVGEGSTSGGDVDGDMERLSNEPPLEVKGEVGGDKRVKGRTVMPSDDLNSGSGGGYGPDDAANPQVRGDDSFAGEVSSDEAGGQGG